MRENVNFFQLDKEISLDDKVYYLYQKLEYYKELIRKKEDEKDNLEKHLEIKQQELIKDEELLKQQLMELEIIAKMDIKGI